MRILFITANCIGDAVLTTGVLSYLVDKYPQALFTIACGPVAADLFRAVPRLEKLILLQKQKRHGHWRRLWRECVGTKWDIIVDLRNSLITRFLFAGKVYYRLSHNTGAHKVVDHARALKLNHIPAPHIWIDPLAEAKAKAICSNNMTPIIAFGPAANWPPKQWPIENFVDLARALVGPHGPYEGAKVMIIAAPHEREQVAWLMGAFPREQVLDLIGFDLLSVAACLKRCQLFVGNDSGLMHIAAAVGTPTIGLFGPGWEKVYGPWGEHTRVVRTPEGSQELLDQLPTVGANAPNLMGSLTVESVLDGVQELIESAPAPRKPQKSPRRGRE